MMRGGERYGACALGVAVAGETANGACMWGVAVTPPSAAQVARCCGGRLQLLVHGCICHSVLDTESRHAGVNSKMKSYSKHPVMIKVSDHRLPVTLLHSIYSPASRHRSRSGATGAYTRQTPLASITRAGAIKHINATTRRWEVIQQHPSWSAGYYPANERLK